MPLINYDSILPLRTRSSERPTVSFPPLGGT